MPEPCACRVVQLLVSIFCSCVLLLLVCVMDDDGVHEAVVGTEVSDGIPVHFVDANALQGCRQLGDRRDGDGAVGADTHAPAPPLLARAGTVDCFHLDADDFLGAAYDQTEPDALPDWVEEGDMPALSDASSERSASGSDESQSSRLGGDASSDDDLDGMSIYVGQDAPIGCRPPPHGVRARTPRRRGFQRAGDGRARGSGLDVRSSLQKILVVLFSRQLITLLGKREASDDSSSELLRSCIVNLTALRATYGDVKDSAMAGKVWTLRRSGVVGALLKFQDKGARDNQARDANLAVEVFLTNGGEPIVCCSRLEEDCVRDGCAQRASVLGALEEVMEASGMELPDVLGLLSEDLRISALNQGVAVMYGPSLCVVRREGGSWPFAVVRRKASQTKALWQCHSCSQGAGSCTHSHAAREAAGNEQSDASDDDTDLIASLGRKTRRRSNTIYSTKPRPLVPSQRGLAGHANVLRAAEAGATVRLRAPAECQNCGHSWGGEGLSTRPGVIEFGSGAVASVVEDWTCSSCKSLCVSDGRDQGVVLVSQVTAYTEVYLFESTINLCRNGSSLTAMWELRTSFHQLMKKDTYPASLDALRSLPLFRTAALLYIYLVIEGLPLAVSTCARCTRPDGSLQFICFDGLQLGFKIRYKTPLKRVSLKLRPIKRASVMALTVSDTAVARALGSVLSVATTEHEAIRAASVQTLTAVRGHVIALAVLAGDVEVAGEAVNFAGPYPHAEGRGGQRGFDPVQDGGVVPALIEFFRELFRCGRASRKLALTILSASKEWRSKVPAPLMQRVKDLISAGDEDSGSDTDAAVPAGEDELVVDDIDSAAPVRRRHLSKFAAAVADPVLADAGGVAGETRRRRALLRPSVAVASTAGSAERLVDFVRAVVVEPVVVWAPGADWTAVDELSSVLRAEPFVAADLRRVLRDPAVLELRLLRGAVLSLYPSLCRQPRVRMVLLNLLLALRSTNERYIAFVDNDAMQKTPKDADGNQLLATREQMAAAPPTATFHPREYTDGWLQMEETWDKFVGVYGNRARDALDFLSSGQWAPSFPPLRPMPDFLAVTGSAEDEAPLCNHGMGTANQWTGGTFSGACTCTHPKTIGVVVLEGSESQRMPIEFVMQRMPSMPERIFYDFACAALKLALCRLPFAALVLAYLVDRFHWLKNHVWCSKAMNPDSYSTVDAENTSASEERNAAARGVQNFLRLMKQRNFILVTVYQQAVGNVIAMHRDKLDDDKKAMDARKAAMERMPAPEKALEKAAIAEQLKKQVDDWPLWYRKAYVDASEVADDEDSVINDGATRTAPVGSGAMVPAFDMGAVEGEAARAGTAATSEEAAYQGPAAGSTRAGGDGMVLGGEREATVGGRGEFNLSADAERAAEARAVAADAAAVAAAHDRAVAATTAQAMAVDAANALAADEEVADAEEWAFAHATANGNQ